MQLKTYTTLILSLLMTSLSLTAQVFFTEDFSGGALPDGWTSVDLTSDAGEECLFEFTPLANSPVYTGQAAFMSTTADNGFVIANSDNVPSARATDHTSQLTTSAIDCADKDAVWLGFETFIGVYNAAYPADENAILRVSTNGTDWTDFVVFPDVTDPNSWSNNPKFASINISSVAANQASVFLQWQWIGNWEYIWLIDDISLSTVDPRPSNDMRINSFAAVAQNVQTPASQVEPIGFIADIENIGRDEQLDVNLTITIRDESNTQVFTDILNYGNITSDSLAENSFFDNTYTPAAMPQNYTGTYALEYEGTEPDANPENNELSFDFEVTDTLFSKQKTTNGGFVATNGNSYTIGNVYFVKNATDTDGNQLYARYLSFATGNATELSNAGKLVTTYLLSWDGSNSNNDPNLISGDDFTYEGFNQYVFDGTEGTGLIPVLVNEDDPIPLKANTYYMPAVQYSTNDEVQFNIRADSETSDYRAANFYNEQIERPRPNNVFALGDDFTELTINGFGTNLGLAIQLSIGTNPLLVATKEIQLPADAVSVFPNPAKESTTVDINLTEATNGTLQVFNIQGKIVQTRQLNNIQREQIQLNTSDLPSGQYTLSIKTELGVSNQKLIIQH